MILSLYGLHAQRRLGLSASTSEHNDEISNQVEMRDAGTNEYLESSLVEVKGFEPGPP